jgi:hypothetical protein
MLLKIDLSDTQFAGLARFLASPENILDAPEGYNFLVEGSRCWHASWHAPKPKIATLVSSRAKSGKASVVLEVLEYALIGRGVETIHDLDRDASVYFVPANLLAPLFRSVVRYPSEPTSPNLSRYHLARVI